MGRELRKRLTEIRLFDDDFLCNRLQFYGGI